MEPRNNAARHENQDGINDQRKKSERKDVYRKCQEKQNRLYENRENSPDDRNNKKCCIPTYGNARDKVCGEIKRRRIYEQLQEHI